MEEDIIQNNKKKKNIILSENEELELAPNGDFIIKKEFAENYGIIEGSGIFYMGFTA